MNITMELSKGLLGGGSPTVTPPKPMPDEMAPENIVGARRKRAQAQTGGRQSTILDSMGGDYSRETMGGK